MMRWLRLHGGLALLLAVTASGWLWPVEAPWQTRLILAWNAGVFLFLADALIKVLRAPAVDDIRRRAAVLDQAGDAVLPLALTAACLSELMILTQNLWPGGARLATLATLATVALSWLFIHVIFAFRYAHAFYTRRADGKDRGGLIFPGGEPPDYWDFLHFSLIIGVASQTADIAISDKGLRRLVTLHCVTAFVFNTVTLALAVGLAGNALGG